ncbi:hypothetical protein MFIFM68171_00437 [Madurella fahalii]|uniref:Helix-turn-helix domain-containing protein n=1 Tax=Madurella fahalii TaxID=1157608 RepID=A0ABQ0FXJ5_9PEZI
MGASGSKTAQQAVRKFPSRAPGSAPAAATRTAPRQAAAPRSSPAPSVAPESRSRPQASYAKDEAIRADSMDPDRPEYISADFADRLRKMGIVQPNPTFSPSSIASPFPDASGIKQTLSASRFPSASINATLGVLEARRRLEAQAKNEIDNMGKSTDQGREFLDIATVKQILVLRQRGESASDIEARLRLRPGIAARLGPEGIVSPAA